MEEILGNSDEIQSIAAHFAVELPSLIYPNKEPFILKSLSEIKKMGINHFRLSTTIPDKMVEYFIFLVKYFIKEEKQQELIEYGMLAITANMSGGSL